MLLVVMSMFACALIACRSRPPRATPDHVMMLSDETVSFRRQRGARFGRFRAGGVAEEGVILEAR